MKTWPSRSKEYGVWLAMRARCNNPKSRAYRNYGGRGIRVWPEWDRSDGFTAFIAHVGPRPGDEFTIERIDNDRGYEPGNVRWATRLEQSRNCRDTVFVEVRGERRTLQDVARECGIKPQTLASRIDRGMLVEEAMARPPRPTEQLLTHGGRTMNIRGWAKETGIHQTTLRVRLFELGWTAERALTTPPGPNGKKHHGGADPK